MTSERACGDGFDLGAGFRDQLAGLECLALLVALAVDLEPDGCGDQVGLVVIDGGPGGVGSAVSRACLDRAGERAAIGLPCQVMGLFR